MTEDHINRRMYVATSNTVLRHSFSKELLFQNAWEGRQIHWSALKGAHAVLSRRRKGEIDGSCLPIECDAHGRAGCSCVF